MTSVQRQQIEKLYDEVDPDIGVGKRELSEWEFGFIESLYYKPMSYELSEKQVMQLDRIYEEVYG